MEVVRDSPSWETGDKGHLLGLRPVVLLFDQADGFIQGPPIATWDTSFLGRQKGFVVSEASIVISSPGSHEMNRYWGSKAALIRCHREKRKQKSLSVFSRIQLGVQVA